MTRRPVKRNHKKVSKKVLRRTGRKVVFRGQAYVSMLRRRRMSRVTNTASFVDDIFGQDVHVNLEKPFS